jgi:pilus assembly protein CpaF
MVQIVLSIIAIVVLAGITFLMYRSRKNERPSAEYSSRITVESLGELVSQELAELVRDDDLVITNDKHFEALSYKKRTLAKALDECIYGVEKAKNVVLSHIRYIIERELPEVEDCLEVVEFKDIFYEDPNIQWEVLIYMVKKKHKTDPMAYLCDKYGLDQERDIPNELTGGTNKRCLFDGEFLSKVLEEELNGHELEYNEMLDIITILVYRNRYGFGVVDTLRGLDIDGFNFGTSGSVRYIIDGTYNVPYRTTNSIWVQLNAKWIHFSFLDFMKEEEMKRIVNQLVAWGTTAPMTEKSPYKVNDAYDGARVTAIRPPAGECWACFVRKFSSGLYVKEKLLNKPRIKNWELPSTLIYYLMRGEQTTAFTGQQNTGKTSMMKAAMADVAMVNIRILEMSFELAIRELYPWKNVLTVKPTDYVSAANLQDLLKKTDGYLSMVGEVAEDIVAARMIQFCLIASAFTIFSHHAKTDADLINGLTNSLVACGEYENHDVAMSTVLDAIKNNVHLDFVKGERVIAFISEIVKLNEIEPYPELKKSDNVVDAIDQLAGLQREYYTRTTDRVRFASRHIIEFNAETMTYEAKEGYSEEALRRICSKLKGDDRKNFIAWYRENWAHVLSA